MNHDAYCVFQHCLLERRHALLNSYLRYDMRHFNTLVFDFLIFGLFIYTFMFDIQGDSCVIHGFDSPLNHFSNLQGFSSSTQPWYCLLSLSP